MFPSINTDLHLDSHATGLNTPSCRSLICLHTSLTTDFLLFLTHKLSVCFTLSSSKHSAPSNLVPRSLPSLLNLSTGEKPRGEEDEAERTAGGGDKRNKTHRGQESEAETVRKQHGQEASVGEEARRVY